MDQNEPVEDTRRPLSSRPRLPPGLSLVSRSPDTAQLGHAVTVSGGERVYEVLSSLDGRHSYSELLQRCADPELLRWAIAELDEACLLEDVEPDAYPGRLTGDMAIRALQGQPARRVVEARSRASVVVHGDSRISIATALALTASGVGRVHLAATGAVRAQDCGNGYRDTDIGRPRAKVAPELLREASSSTRFDRLPPDRSPNLVIFADTPVPNPEVVASMQSAGIPQLLAYPRDGVGVVGPLVLPGWTGCVRCIDLWRTGRDPCWPRIATQYAGTPQPCPLVVANATSAFATAQALRYLDGDRLEHLHDSAVDLYPDLLRTRVRRWYPSPICDCVDQVTRTQNGSPESHSEPAQQRERG